ncbi:unnamed protein product [Alternaria alternata]
MQSNLRAQAEIQAQRKKQLANSYKQLLDEFAATDLKTVGNYTLGKLIGKGSFGKVYLASHKLSNGSKVVLKSAKKDDANLAREIHHHRQFIHPHIARLYEVIVTEELVWLVLEYCQGDELYNYLLAKGALEPSRVQKIFTQLVGAVSYVHNKSCVHRDLKLENILLDKHGDVKLVDFGFTREYEGKSNYLQTWCGTICYSAPEMLKGEKYAGEKVDVWSLGIILYALLVGELPFDEDDEMVTKNKILKEEPKYPEHFPQQARELCSSLLSKRPILRPTLAEILQNPWLSEHAPRQQEILKLQQPAPFSTELEKEVLHRMRAAGVDIDMVIENVLAQRCDSLAGWWALLLEKEERKAKRRERKRKEKEAEAKSLRRLSAASSRLDKLAPTIRESDEEGIHAPTTPKSRGRTINRSSLHGAPELPKLPESMTSPNLTVDDKPLPPIDTHRVPEDTSKHVFRFKTKAKYSEPFFRAYKSQVSADATHTRSPTPRFNSRLRLHEKAFGIPCPIDTAILVSSFFWWSTRPEIYFLICLFDPQYATPPPFALESFIHILCLTCLSGRFFLPATPTSSSFPSNIRLVRSGFPPGLNESSAAFGNGNSIPPQSPGLIFAKRKRSPFKGPMLNVNTGVLNGGHANGGAWRSRSGDSGMGSRGTSVQGRRSGEILGITEEDEEEEEEVEEVETFGGKLGEGEFVEEEGPAQLTPPLEEFKEKA